MVKNKNKKPKFGISNKVILTNDQKIYPCWATMFELYAFRNTEVNDIELSNDKEYVGAIAEVINVFSHPDWNEFVYHIKYDDGKEVLVGADGLKKAA